MKKIGLLISIALLSFQGFSQQKNFIDQPYIETTAMVDTLVVPDRIYLSIRITEKDTKDKTPVEELENRMNAKLIELGIDTKKQLSLSDLTSNFKKYVLKKTDVLKNKTYMLVVYDAETAGKVIVGLESIKISNVRLNKVAYSQLEQLKINLKQKAVLKAKKQAEAMLKPLNQNIGKAIYISDLNSNIGYSLHGKTSGIQIRGYSSSKAEKYNPIDIEFEKIKVESTVTIKFGIE